MRLSKRTIVASAATLALVGAGMAFATFGNTADETGSTGGVDLTVAVSEDGIPELPPNQDEEFTATITNTDTTDSHTVGSFNVWLQNADGSGFGAQADTGYPACTWNDFDVWVDEGDDPAGEEIAASGTLDVTVKVALRERSWDQRNCLNLEDSVPFHLEVTQSS